MIGDKKILLMTEIISPYRIPVFNAVAQVMKDKFLVFFLAATEKRRHWKIYKENIKFNYAVLPHILFQKKGFDPYFFNPTVIYQLIKHSPDIIITSGYQHPTYFLALLYAKFFKKKVILWCESNKSDWRLGYPVIESYKRWFVKNCRGYLVPGKASFQYVVSLGGDKEKIWIAQDAVDNNYFNLESQRYAEDKETIKKVKGYPEKIILYVGRLVNHKGIPDLLQAFHILSQQHTNLGLLFVGEGIHEADYRHFCQVNRIRNVFFTGFIQQEELPFYYGICDVFVLPSHSEPWGLVLNEAMACGLPVIASDAVGAAGDLIKNGENGYIFKRGNIEQLAGYIEDILNDNPRKEVMGNKSLEIICDYSPLRCAEGIIKAVNQI